MATKKRLIDANAVVKNLEYEIETQCQPIADSDEGLEAFVKKVIPKLLRDVINYIKQQPTVDAVEVVRCKDCKYWSGYGGRCKHWGSPLAGTVHYTNAGDFCSYGERRTDNERKAD